MRVRVLILILLAIAGLAGAAWAAPPLLTSPLLGEDTDAEWPALSDTCSAEPGLGAFGGPADNSPRDAEESGATALPNGDKQVVKLSAPPAALLMVLQGILCIAFVRGRRKWAAIVFAALSLGRTGWSALPQFMQGGWGHASQPTATRPIEPKAQRVVSEARTPDAEFFGLLRRLGPGPDDAPSYAAAFCLRVSGRSVDSRHVSSVSPLPAVILVDRPSIPQDGLWLSPRAYGSHQLSSQPVLLPLLARPPPVSA